MISFAQVGRKLINSLPGKTPNEAFDAYARPLKDALACITSEVLLRRRVPKSDGKIGIPLWEFLFINNPVRLKDSPFAFNFSQYFRVVPFDPGYKVKTEAYTYEIMDDATRHELFSFHWEPNAPSSQIKIPHMHLGFATKGHSLPIDNKAHVPSGRVSVEDVISFLISELGVPPLRLDWKDTIATTRQAFMTYKSW